ncbi:ArsR/SmtB family transcription factor [Fructilactobacillus lindneri]|uniref:HTH arsR-type domain-containing protein n=1 Tax=Fructilactobacillus lindneri DSM 20690 = JCM 11027 TaxID=1122148 RepID=A0A0R2JM05_9LACO|nr:metalloregulator ArsR/SmtB family transcription factor [Fructilactobacillus lindneri]KRN78240.1 hypothetical protein IV52_GL001374 [Fructilactobacillus lindneri DSM 20690 = JCM 11027]SJZ95328.1 DNA-binding transcriptional regulator, ArsR family [Fructilactobacillus lindneri DSM 20690 = JCM 11027]
MENYNENDLAKIFKALSDPNRIKILKILIENQTEMTCGEVSSHLKLSLSTVSYHFKILRHAGLTKMRKEGHEKYLSVNQPLLNKLNLIPVIKKDFTLK